MKRHGNLFEIICDRDNLRHSLKQACKPNGRTSPAKKRAVARAKADPELYVDKVLKILQAGHKTGEYARFALFDPKLRFIYSLPFFPDRVVHHALLTVLEPIWDSLMMHTSYACRKGKGQHEAGKACTNLTRRFKYVAQFDVAQFYVSINHEILKGVIRRKIKDQKVLAILDEIIDSISTRDENLKILYKMREKGSPNPDVEREIKKLESSRERDNHAPAGLPIGSYTSQWFGNLYMNELDEYLKHQLKCRNVIRYCDDFLVFSNDKQFLHDVREKVKVFMWDRLHMMLSKAEVFPTSQGVDFCGYRYFPKGFVLLRKRTAKRQKKQMNKIRKGLANNALPRESARSKIASMDGWLRWANCHNWKKQHGFYELKKEFTDGNI